MSRVYGLSPFASGLGPLASCLLSLHSSLVRLAYCLMPLVFYKWVFFLYARLGIVFGIRLHWMHTTAFPCPLPPPPNPIKKTPPYVDLNYHAKHQAGCVTEAHLSSHLVCSKHKSLCHRIATTEELLLV
jgi:hypothetical protein